MRLLLLACTVLAGACTVPTAPSYTCTTQPRTYVLPNGTISVERETANERFAEQNYASND